MNDSNNNFGVNHNDNKYILLYTNYEPEKQECKEIVKNTINSLYFKN